MGAAKSHIRRSVKNINLEYRAEQKIDKNATVPEAAPRHKTEKLIDLDLSDREKMHTKSNSLIQRVDKFKIIPSVQTGIIPGDEKGDFSSIVKESKRPLPQRIPTNLIPEPEHEEFGYHEPKVVPAGKLTLKSAFHLIVDFKENPSSLSQLCDKYKVEEKQILDIVRNFFPYRLGNQDEYHAMFETHQKLLEDSPKSSNKSSGHDEFIKIPKAE